MKKLNVHPEVIPFHKIVFAATSYPDYEMDRVMLVEDYPEYTDLCLVTGSHCSCYDFDDATWDVMQYTKKELKELMKTWADTGYGAEKIIAPLILDYIR